MKRRDLLKSGLAALLFGLHFGAFAQHEELHIPDSLAPKSYSSVNDWFEHATWRFHGRSYGMATLNQGNLRDDATWALGGELGLVTAPVGHWHLGLSGFFIFEMMSTDIDQEWNGMRNRYEIGQYDVTDRGNTVGLERLEDLYLEGRWENQTFRIGRQTLETPFFNKQDGRMRPTTEEGLVYEAQVKGWELEGMAIWAFSPRSTVEWYKLSESVGLYGTGYHPVTGERHALEIESAGDVLGAWHAVTPEWKSWKAHAYQMWWPGVFQTQRLGVDRLPAETGGLLSLHYYHQTALGEGGNADPNKAYVTEDHTAVVYSGRMGYAVQNGEERHEWTLNATRITDDGRYVMPREWGRDPFFTFLPRERNEGLADVWAATLKWDYQHNHQEWILAGGLYALPAWDDFTRNKYQTPSYNQLYVEWADALTGFWKGVKLRTMLAYKWSNDSTLPDVVKVNTVNMVNASFIVDYHF